MGSGGMGSVFALRKALRLEAWGYKNKEHLRGLRKNVLAHEGGLGSYSRTLQGVGRSENMPNSLKTIPIPGGGEVVI